MSDLWHVGLITCRTYDTSDLRPVSCTPWHARCMWHSRLCHSTTQTSAHVLLVRKRDFLPPERPFQTKTNYRIIFFSNYFLHWSSKRFWFGTYSICAFHIPDCECHIPKLRTVKHWGHHWFTQLSIRTNFPELATQVATLESFTFGVHIDLHLNPIKFKTIAFWIHGSNFSKTRPKYLQSLSVAGSHMKVQTKRFQCSPYLFIYLFIYSFVVHSRNAVVQNWQI